MSNSAKFHIGTPGQFEENGYPDDWDEEKMDELAAVTGAILSVCTGTLPQIALSALTSALSRAIVNGAQDGRQMNVLKTITTALEQSVLLEMADPSKAA